MSSRAARVRKAAIERGSETSCETRTGDERTSSPHTNLGKKKGVSGQTLLNVGVMPLDPNLGQFDS